ncbi:MAG TPA: hypothetical protein VGC41_23245, partial [Kofleriaceae bacterium]
MLYALLIGSCGGPKGTVASIAPSSQASSQEVSAKLTTDRRCAEVAVFEGGVAKGSVCATEVVAKGLTLVDLTDTWTPGLFQPAEGQTPSFHDRYLQLANERDADAHPIEGEDALDELYGVVPSLQIVEARLADEQRHQCSDAIDPKPILALEKTFSQDYKAEVAMADQARRVYAAQFEKERVRRKLPDPSALADDPTWKDRYARWQKLDAQHTALVTAEQKLRCEGWLTEKETDGSFTWRTGNAMEMFQRRNFLMP